jgi:hypothetical protein
VGEACAVCQHQLWQDISNELQKKISVDIIEPVHYFELIRKHVLREAMIRSGQQHIQWERQDQENNIEAAVLVKDPDAPMRLAIIQNDIAQGYFSSINEVAMELSDF